MRFTCRVTPRQHAQVVHARGEAKVRLGKPHKGPLLDLSVVIKFRPAHDLMLIVEPEGFAVPADGSGLIEGAEDGDALARKLLCVAERAGKRGEGDGDAGDEDRLMSAGFHDRPPHVRK
jgi:hypothetical protein